MTTTKKTKLTKNEEKLDKAFRAEGSSTKRFLAAAAQAAATKPDEEFVVTHKGQFKMIDRLASKHGLIKYRCRLHKDRPADSRIKVVIPKGLPGLSGTVVDIVASDYDKLKGFPKLYASDELVCSFTAAMLRMIAKKKLIMEEAKAAEAAEALVDDAPADAEVAAA